MDSSPKDKMLQGAKESYEKWYDIVTIQEGDSKWVKARKITLRILGTILFILLSPFLFLGLLIAFLAVF